jgi:hypothetical protein
MSIWGPSAWATSAWMRQLIPRTARPPTDARGIRLGARFRQVSVSAEWEVVARFHDHDGIPHVRIRNLCDLGTTKDLACTALLNPRRFRVSE